MSKAEKARIRRRERAAAEGRDVRVYRQFPTSMPINERKRLSRIMGLPGFKAVRHEAHVVEWKAHLNSPAVRQAGKLHAAHIQAWRKAERAAWFRHQYRNDPVFNAKQKMRARLRRIEKGDSDIARLIANQAKKGKWMSRWRDVLGYGLEDLIKHLKRTVPKRHTWDDFLSGDLHIDHIIPRSKFDTTTLEGVRACWCLSNLQLLPAKANLAKGATVSTLL